MRRRSQLFRSGGGPVGGFLWLLLNMGVRTSLPQIFRNLTMQPVFFWQAKIAIISCSMFTNFILQNNPRVSIETPKHNVTLSLLFYIERTCSSSHCGEFGCRGQVLQFLTKFSADAVTKMKVFLLRGSTQGRINHLGAPYQRKAGPFSHTRSQDFLWGALLFFSRRYV